jgi:putative ABC transport system ATP-binding protein
VLADEPTANLDQATGRALVGVMRELNREQGVTFVFSTHDPMVLEHADRVVRLVDGKIASDSRAPSSSPPAA